jgi:ADP-ribosylglycohydrolase
MFLYAKIGIVLAIVGAVGGGALYVKNLRADLETARINQKLLEQTVEEQKMLLEVKEKDIALQKEITKELEANREASEQSIADLNERLNKVNEATGKQREIDKAAVKKTKLVTKIINNASNNIMRCLEIASGSPLTPDEIAATKKSETNGECPHLANPNYVPKEN